MVGQTYVQPGTSLPGREDFLEQEACVWTCDSSTVRGRWSSVARARAQTMRTSSEVSVPSLPPEPAHVGATDAPPAWLWSLQNQTHPPAQSKTGFMMSKQFLKNCFQGRVFSTQSGRTMRSRFGVGDGIQPRCVWSQRRTRVGAQS